mgnify:CR=1 FL=1
MAFAQLTWRESLRDIETVLNANAGKLYGMGLRHAVRRSTLADANETRDWRIWADVAALLIRRARKLYANEPLGLAFNGALAVGLASGKKIKEAVQWATVGAALSVTKNGAQSSLPNKKSFQQLLDQQTLLD